MEISYEYKLTVEKIKDLLFKMSNSEASETPTEIIIDPNVTRCNENILGFAVTAIKTAEDRTLNITLQQLRDSDENLCDVTLVADDGTR